MGGLEGPQPADSVLFDPTRPQPDDKLPEAEAWWRDRQL